MTALLLTAFSLALVLAGCSQATTATPPPDTQPEEVTPPNTAPMVNAGRDHWAASGEPVTLQGSGTDAENDDLTYSWTHSGGSPKVALRNADQPTASFVAPDVSESADLTFTLTVTDADGLIGSDTITVTVQPLPISPEAAADLSQPSVRLIYFLPNDRAVRPERVRALRQLIEEAQHFYADEMESHGVGRKRFVIESHKDGIPVVYRIDGRFSEDYYYEGNSDFKIWEEVLPQFDDFRHVYFIAIDLSQESLNDGEACGLGGPIYVPTGESSLNFGSVSVRHRFMTQGEQVLGGSAIIPASGECFEDNRGFQHKLRATIHELGHAFGLEHDPRDTAAAIGGRGYRLSECDAEWLSVSPFFNTGSFMSGNSPGKIEIVSEPTHDAEGVTLRFKVTDADGLHQSQLLVPEIYKGTSFGAYRMFGCKQASGHEDTVEFVSPALLAEPVDRITLQIIDRKGSITWATLPFP